MKPIVIGMKIALAGVMIWMYIMFSGLIDRTIFELASFNELFTSLFRLLNVGFYYLLQLIWDGLGFLFEMSFANLPFFSSSFFTSVSQQIFDSSIVNWFSLPDNIAQYNFNDDIQILTGELYVLIFQILFLLMVIYGIRSILQSDPKFSIRTITILNLMIFIPLMLVGIEEMVKVFTPSFNFSQIIGIYNPAESEEYLLPFPLDPTIIDINLLELDFVAFFNNKMFLTALSAFIYIEVSFQLNYVYQVTSPTEKREKRLKIQLEIVKKAAQQAVVDLENIEKEKKEEEKMVMDEEGNIIEKEKPMNVRQMLRKGTTGFTHISEMIERRKLEDKTKKVIEALHDTRRLSNYMNRLLEEDPDAEFSLTAKSSAPTAGKLISSTIIDMIIRIIGISFLVVIVAQTPTVLVDIFQVPLALSESAEMVTPEVTLTLLIPIILLFPMISVIIRKTKESHLKAKLKEEKERREGLEEDMLVPA